MKTSAASDWENFPKVQTKMRIFRALLRAPQCTINAEGVKTPDSVSLANCEKVWDIISRITQKDAGWTYATAAQRARNGRMAYQVMYGHYRISWCRVSLVVLSLQGKIYVHLLVSSLHIFHGFRCSTKQLCS